MLQGALPAWAAPTAAAGKTPALTAAEIAMLEHEVNSVIKALRADNLEVSSRAQVTVVNQKERHSELAEESRPRQ